MNIRCWKPKVAQDRFWRPENAILAPKMAILEAKRSILEAKMAGGENYMLIFELPQRNAQGL